MAKATCSIEDCDRSAHTRGWCGAHYQSWRRHGDPLVGRRIELGHGSVCSVSDCDKPHLSRGLCATHYKRWSKHGDPLLGAAIRCSGSCSVEGCGKPAKVHDLCMAHYQAQYREQHRAKARARTAKYRADNPERVRAAMARWMSDPENRRVFREHQRRYRAQKKTRAVGVITPELLDAKLAYWGWRCWMCGGLPTDWDHVKPLVKGGLHCLANLRPACGDCNKRKMSRWPYPTHRRSAPWQTRS